MVAATRREAALGPGRGASAARPSPGGGAAMLSLALLVSACGGETPPATEVPDSVYVEVVARLMLVDSAFGTAPGLPAGDAPVDSLRARILEEWGVRGDELVEFARTRGAEPEQMQAIWRRVRDLRDSLEEAGWRAPSPGTDTVRLRDGPEGEGPDRGGTAPDTPGAAGAAPAGADTAGGRVPGDSTRDARP